MSPKTYSFEITQSSKKRFRIFSREVMDNFRRLASLFKLDI